MMPRKFIKRYLPSRKSFHETSQLRPFHRFFGNPCLWHLNRRTVSGAVAIGLFTAYLPMPLEMLFAAMLAIIFKVNLPISVSLVWVSNPVTWIPLYGAGYMLGAKILGKDFVNIHEMTMSWLMSQAIPLWLGSLILGSLLALTGYLATRALWRIHAIRNWEKRRQRRCVTKDDCA
ncbi:hypothetical protein BMS3Bbin11_00144 [bacterium BMS3Bbin11]|nr:hypothetical protein BMS3Abin11_02558 [bacterium BMS3Abin11]GBE45065.1 hypothetical protein BMS3Bbin11_00144 [bacterium BMS3Bbin11]GMT40948.1 MAG: ATP-binding protein [bacterium]